MTQAPGRIWAAHRQGKTTTILAGHSNARVEGWTEYVRADLCRASAAPADDALRVAVKPLKWEWDTRDVGDFWSASSPVGEYEVGISDDGYAFACCDGPSMWEWRPEEDARMLKLSDAKAAAQADYEGRIRAALEDRT